MPISDAQLAADAETMLADFPESLVYRKFADQSTRNISGVVSRMLFDPVSGAQYPTARLSIAVVNSATNGVTAAELNKGKDEILVALRAGGTAEYRTITNLSDADGGMVYLEVR